MNLTAEVRTRIAVGAIVGTYALAWVPARTSPVPAMLAFGLAAMPVAGVFLYRGVSKGVGNLVIQSLLVMMSVAIPPIFLLLCLWRLAIGIERTTTFLRPSERTVRWLGLADGEYRDIEHSSLIDLGPRELTKQIDWP